MPVVSSDAKLPTTGCIILPAALFIALMIATAGTAIYPPLAHLGAVLLCSGEVQYESHGASYRPGEYTVTRQIYCAIGAGKEARRDEITFQAIGISFLFYAAFFFLLLRFVVAPWLRRRAARALQAVVGRPATSPGAPAAPIDLRAILSQVSTRVRDATATGPDDGRDGDPAERLLQLKALRDQGLITAAEYEAKKAEILSRL